MASRLLYPGKALPGLIDSLVQHLEAAVKRTQSRSAAQLERDVLHNQEVHNEPDEDMLDKVNNLTAAAGMTARVCATRFVPRAPRTSSCALPLDRSHRQVRGMHMSADGREDVPLAMCRR